MSRLYGRSGWRVRVLIGAAGTAAALSVAQGGAVAAPAGGQGSVTTGFGDNHLGQIGNGTTTSSSVPTPVLTGGLPAAITAIDAGRDFSLALLADGSVYSWGVNTTGQLGSGTLSSAPRTVPGRVTGLPPVTQVDTRISHTLALATDGTVWTWGANDSGQLGDGTSGTASARATPARVPGLTGVVEVAAGQSFSLALRSDGTVWGWGSDASREILGPDVNPIPHPVQLPGLSGVTHIAAGAFHGLALQADGTLWAWGDNSFGELGIGSTTSVHVPVHPLGLTGVTRIAAGSLNSYAVAGADSSVWSWGGNFSGQIGNGTTSFAGQTVPFHLSLTGIRALVTGASAVAALTTDGHAFVWGANNNAALGIGGSPTTLTVPTLHPTLDHIATLAIGDRHGLAQTTP